MLLRPQPTPQPAPRRPRGTPLQSLCGTLDFRRFCSARLQAGTVDSSTWSPATADERYRTWPRVATRTLQLELRHLREMLCPGVDLRALQRSQPVETEFLHGKASHHRTVYHRAPEFRIAQAGHAGQIPHETAGKRVARASRIVDLFE